MRNITNIPEKYNRIYAEIDLDAFRNNLECMRACIHNNTKIVAVVKTDGYGHGSVKLAEIMEGIDYVYGYAVATYEEAHNLRLHGMKKPILILGYTFPYCFESLIDEDITPAVFREDTLLQLNEIAKSKNKKMSIHIKVDTGMGRIGIVPGNDDHFIKVLNKCEYLNPQGIFMHFASADEADKTKAYGQHSIFMDYIHHLKADFGLEFQYIHCANSAAIFEMTDTAHDLVRAGITLYGLSPSDEFRRENTNLIPILTLKSKIVYIKTIHKGDSVSYGGTYIATKDTVVATIPVGYGDGYPRALSGKGFVIIRGKKVPIIGRVCMDQFMVDVTDIPDVEMGDDVVLIGCQGNESLTAEEVGNLCGRFNYELMCDLGKRIPRIYVDQGVIVDTLDNYS